MGDGGREPLRRLQGVRAGEQGEAPASLYRAITRYRSSARTNRFSCSDIIFRMEFAAAEAGAVHAAGRPLEGIRVLAIEPKPALPHASQLVGPLGGGGG